VNISPSGTCWTTLVFLVYASRGSDLEGRPTAGSCCIVDGVFVDYSRWWTRQHGSSTACVTQTTSRTRWLRAPEIAVLMCEATHETSPSYLSHLVRVADLPGRRYLRLLVLSVSAAGPSQSPRQCDLCSVSADLPLVSKNISVPGLDSLKFTSITRYLLLGPL